MACRFRPPIRYANSLAFEPASVGEGQRRFDVYTPLGGMRQSTRRRNLKSDPRPSQDKGRPDLLIFKAFRAPKTRVPPEPANADRSESIDFQLLTSDSFEIFYSKYLNLIEFRISTLGLLSPIVLSPIVRLMGSNSDRPSPTTEGQTFARVGARVVGG